MLPLKPSDKVALIAPASGQKVGQDNLVEAAVQMLANWGLDVVQTPVLKPLLKPLNYLASDDASRAQSLHEALTSPDIKAIFVTRGGYGCARLIPHLHNIVVPSPRLLLGFSDITTLHLHFSGVENLQRIHAANLATLQFLADSEAAKQNRDTLKTYLFNGDLPPLALSPLFDEESSSPAMLPNAPLTGGCLSLLVTSLGTPYEIDTTGKILMIEEVGESPYQLDRLLTHLKSAGKFAQARAVVIGSLHDCDSPNIPALDVVRDVLGDVDCPIFTNQTFGHANLNLPWIYG